MEFTIRYDLTIKQVCICLELHEWGETKQKEKQITNNPVSVETSNLCWYLCFVVSRIKSCHIQRVAENWSEKDFKITLYKMTTRTPSHSPPP